MGPGQDYIVNTVPFQTRPIPKQCILESGLLIIEVVIRSQGFYTFYTSCLLAFVVFFLNPLQLFFLCESKMSPTLVFMSFCVNSEAFAVAVIVGQHETKTLTSCEYNIIYQWYTVRCDQGWVFLIVCSHSKVLGFYVMNFCCFGRIWHKIDR